MPLTNRVTPFGDLIRTPARGSLLGNRGILHDAEGKLTGRGWSHWNWVYCRTDVPGRRQVLNAPGHYTQLFFLDEATALAAGHRPCGCCQHSRLDEFLSAWRQGNPEHAASALPEIDRILQRERVTPQRAKITIRRPLKDLPAGTMVMFPELKGIYHQLGQEQLRMWSPFGYLPPEPAPMDRELIVLTPSSMIHALAAGFLPATAGDKPTGEGAPHWHEEWCLKILEQLKHDFPLPKGTRLFLDFQPVKLVRSGRTTGGGICSNMRGSVSIKMAMGDAVPLKTRLTRMAHEYWHAYQHQVCHQPGDSRFFGRIEEDAREFSKGYAHRFMLERGLIPDGTDENGPEARRKRLLIHLEAIIGRHFYNPHYPPAGPFGPQGGIYRHPVTIREGKKKKDHYYLPEHLSGGQLRSAIYAFRDREFRIMEALEEMVQYLEENELLQFQGQTATDLRHGGQKDGD